MCKTLQILPKIHTINLEPQASRCYEVTGRFQQINENKEPDREGIMAKITGIMQNSTKLFIQHNKNCSLK